MKTAYAVIVVTRNGASTIERTLDTILDQTLEPACVCAVNDGSTDSTAGILATYQRRNQGKFFVVTQPDRGYDIRRVPANLNSGYSRLKTREHDYLMISGDHCTYPREYARSLISRMASDAGVVVASGQPRTGGRLSQEHLPSGGGRMIRCSFWQAVGGKYPIRAGWEAWLLYKAMEKGFKVRLFDDLIFENLRPRGAVHGFRYWGAAMYALGYHPLYVLGRVAMNLLKRRVTLTGSVNMFRGYLLAFLGSSDPFISIFEQSLRSFVRAHQARRIASIVTTLEVKCGHLAVEGPL